MSTSNRVGHPVRNRKRNRLIYNEDEETSFGPQTNRGLSVNNSENFNQISCRTSQTSKTNLSNKPDEFVFSSQKSKFNKSIGTSLANSLKTMLKLPKANSWVNHEWFYGNIDQVLFLDENEFNFCLRESFPQLKTRYLTRLEWCQVRKLLGKPRRCSESFFQEERSTLNNKRTKIRFLQQNKVADLHSYKELPENIPQPLMVGNHVSALARSCDGSYFGRIEGIDPVNGTYRISFDRTDMACLSVPDYEVVSADVPLLAPLSSFQIKTRKIWHLTNRFVDCSEVHDTPTKQTIAQTEKLPIIRSTNEIAAEQTIGGFPIKFLSFVVKASKLLTLKTNRLKELKAMNGRIEQTATSEAISYTFKKKYALTILHLHKINQELRFNLKKIQNFSLQAATEGKLKSLKPDILTQKYMVESKRLIEKLQGKFKVNEKNHNLIHRLMCLLVHLRAFQDCDVTSYEFESLNKALSSIRSIIHKNNAEIFQNNVEIHVRHIMTSVTHLGNCGIFSESTTANTCETSKQE